MSWFSRNNSDSYISHAIYSITHPKFYSTINRSLAIYIIQIFYMTFLCCLLYCCSLLNSAPEENSDMTAGIKADFTWDKSYLSSSVILHSNYHTLISILYITILTFKTWKRFWLYLFYSLYEPQKLLDTQEAIFHSATRWNQIITKMQI